jgi:hypothetical protein
MPVALPEPDNPEEPLAPDPLPEEEEPPLVWAIAGREIETTPRTIRADKNDLINMFNLMSNFLRRIAIE